MRLLVLACLVGYVAANAYWPWDPRVSRNPGHSASGYIPASTRLSTVFFPSGSTPITSAQAAVNEIKDLMINVERNMQRFCRKYTDRPLKEAYGATHYRLYANLTGCKEEGVEVRAGQRLVAVQVRDSRCDYIGLRLLPDAVDSNTAFWRFENGQLNILFPYNPSMRRCGRVISDNVHRVPKFELDTEYPDVDVRIGDNNLGKAVRLYPEDHDDEEW